MAGIGVVFVDDFLHQPGAIPAVSADANAKRYLSYFGDHSWVYLTNAGCSVAQFRHWLVAEGFSSWVRADVLSEEDTVASYLQSMIGQNARPTMLLTAHSEKALEATKLGVMSSVYVHPELSLRYDDRNQSWDEIVERVESRRNIPSE